MDSLTHIVAGAVTGDLILGKKVGKKGMLFGAIAGSAPDVDAVLNFFVSDVDSLVMHRGITHSIFVALTIGPLLGWLLWKWFNKQDGTRSGWIALVTVNILFHLFFDIIFVADPLYTIPLLIASVVLLILKSDSTARARVAITGLILSSAYMTFAFYAHAKAIGKCETALQSRNINATSIIATPTLMNTVLWNIVAADTGGYWNGYCSVLDAENEIPELTFIPQQVYLSDSIQSKEDLAKMIQFADGFYTLTNEEGKIRFNVLRFGQVSGWIDPASKCAFSFDMTPGADNSMVVQQGRIETTKKEVLEAMVERMGF
ncbi:MAG: metal-dependent hydrolase [Bacteroidetes bacterium]|nr:metal-dependent hydrolase [Bacteroidota bacterium]